MPTRYALSWLVLLMLSGLLIWAMRVAEIPGAFMIGPLLAGIVVTVSRPGISVPRSGALLAQALLGSLIAAIITPDMLAMLLLNWPLLLGGNALLIIGVTAIGVVATVFRVLPGTSAIWGISPGGASAMVVLSEDYGGDRRLVALLQYSRLIGLALFVVAISTIFGTEPSGTTNIQLPGLSNTPWLQAPATIPFACVVILTLFGFWAAASLGWSSLVILLPLFGGIALQFWGNTRLEVPPLVSSAAFAVIGWNVGLGFTKQTLSEYSRALPRVALLFLAVLAMSLAIAVAFARVAEVDYMTAYLSLNPGGVDIVLLAAAHLDVDLHLVLAMQVSRILMVVLAVPILGRIATHWLAEPPLD